MMHCLANRNQKRYLKKSFILLGCLLSGFAHNKVCGQNVHEALDSMQVLYSSESDSLVKMGVGCIELSKEKTTQNIVESVYWAKKAREYGSRAGDSSILYRSYWILGMVYNVLTKFDSSLVYLDSSGLFVRNSAEFIRLHTAKFSTHWQNLEHDKAYQTSLLLDSAYQNSKFLPAEYSYFLIQKAAFLQNLNMFQDALEVLYKNLEYASQNNLKEYQPGILTNIGIIQYEMNLYSESKQNYKKSLKLLKEIHQTEFQTHPDAAAIYQNLSNSYFAEDLCDSALWAQKEAVRLYAHQNNLKATERAKMNLISKLKGCDKIQMAKSQIRQIDTTKLNTFQKIHYEIEWADLLIKTNIGKEEQILRAAEKALQHKLFNLYRDAQEILIDHYQSTNNYQAALKAQQRMQWAQDSIMSSSKKNVLHQKLIQHMMKLKDSVIQRAQQEKQLHQQRATIYRLQLIIAVCCAILLIVVFAVIRRRYKRKVQKLHQQKNVQQQQINKQEDYIRAQKDQLQQLSLSMVEKSNLIEKVEKELKQVSSQNDLQQKSVDKLKNELRNKMGMAPQRDQIEELTHSAYQDFIVKLRAISTELSPQEERLAVLVSLKHSSKEIAGILNITPASADTYKNRLKTKLKVPKEQRLGVFLLELLE